MEWLVNLVSQLGHAAYLVIFLAVCLESAAFLGFLVPGETLVLLGGFLASQGVLDLGDLMALVAVAAVIGDSIGYEMGRHLGRDWLLRVGRRFGLGEEQFQRVERFFERHGGKTIFLARFSALFRVMVPFVAGTARFPYGRFLIYNILGGAAWAVASVLAGYVAGESWSLVEHWIGRAGAVVGLLLVLAIVSVWLWRWLARNEDQLKRWRAAFLARPWVAAVRRRLAPWALFLHARLSPGGYLGLNLTIGVVVLMGAAWLFGAIVQNVVAGAPLTRFDQQAAEWVSRHRDSGLTLVMRLLHGLGGPWVVGLISLGMAGYVLVRRQWDRLRLLVLVVPGGVLLNGLTKVVFHGVRPRLENPFTLLSAYGFPDAHTNAAVLIYGLLAVLAIRSLPGWREHVSAALAAALVVVLIGFSGVYLGEQYPSSSLAGAAEGVAWLALCDTGMETWRRTRE